MKKFDVAIIGAGPSGAIAACFLRQKGYSVVIIERQRFPRFVIGESLLPQSLKTLEKAGCLEAVKAKGFQEKTGATFKLNRQYADIVFSDKFSQGPGTAFHVQRSVFDQTLADCAIAQGAQVYYEHTVTAVQAKCNDCHITYRDDLGEAHKLHCRFILDASGYGRVLPKLLGLNKPSSLPPRGSVFTHVKDNIPADSPHQRATTLITVHPKRNDVWYWLISFSNGRSSFGAVGCLDYLKTYQEKGLQGVKDILAEDEGLSDILAKAEFDTPAQSISAYSSDVSALYGDGFALLGNAAEFLDPVFSSGVTVAMYSADLAAQAVDKTLAEQPIDWASDYSDELKRGIDVFRHYVEAWYDGSLQKVIFTQDKRGNVRSMVAAILAGYAWDRSNPFVQNLEKLDTLSRLCD